MKCILNIKKPAISIFAFTLAEVLIVLVIIGVIAAMVIPTLVTKVQNQEYVTQLKKFYTTMDNGFTQILANDGVSGLDDSSVFQSIPETGFDECELGVTLGDSPNCTDFSKNLNKYIKNKLITVPNDYTIYYLNGTKNVSTAVPGCTIMVLPDGMFIMGLFYKDGQASTPVYKDSKWFQNDSNAISSYGGHLYNIIGVIEVDVNGFKKPNTYGRDIFTFTVGNDARLYPGSGKDVAIYWNGALNSNTSYWRNNTNFCGTPNSKNAQSSNGMGCAARIMEAGWQMNY